MKTGNFKAPENLTKDECLDIAGRCVCEYEYQPTTSKL